MLVRIMFAASVVAFSGCGRSPDSKLVGSWHWNGCDDAGSVDYRADHTFSSLDWAVSYSHQPPIVADTGKWHVHRDRLIMDFKGDTRPADGRHIELPFTFFGNDTLVVRATDGKVNTFERVK
jgi:hypothetical protein